MAADGPEATSRFHFHDVGGTETFPCMKDQGFAEYLHKWGMDQCMSVRRFRYDEAFAKEDRDAFLHDFFNSPEVQSAAKVSNSLGNMSVMGRGEVDSVEADEISVKIVSMTFFDCLKRANLVRENGGIKKCLDEYVDNLQVSDLVRKMLVVEDCEEHDAVSEGERREFLFHIFRRMVVGGSLCQYEDYLQPYYDTTRAFYKDMVNVQKNPVTKEIQVVSHVYEIKGIKGSLALFPSKANMTHSFCYVAVDPIKRIATYWYLAHLPMW